MTTIHFKAIDPQEIKERFSDYFWEKTTYFLIQSDGEEAALYGIIHRGNKTGDAFLTVFERHRYKLLNKKTLNDLFNHPFSLGFTEVWTWTRLQSWIKLLKRIEGVEFRLIPPSWDNDFTKIWFRKRI